VVIGESAKGLCGQLFATTGPAGAQNAAATNTGFSGAKTVATFTFDAAWLKCTLHGINPLIYKRKFMLLDLWQSPLARKEGRRYASNARPSSLGGAKAAFCAMVCADRFGCVFGAIPRHLYASVMECEGYTPYLS